VCVGLQNKGKGAGRAKSTCYNCGSTEHSVHDCKAPAAAGGAAFRFASCFVCGEKGHISRECPQNAKGIYIKGGCCKLCQGACDWHAAVISERGR
jgi:zinc finger CCHC domain-containing protein 9